MLLVSGQEDELRTVSMSLIALGIYVTNGQEHYQKKLNNFMGSFFS